MTEPVNPAACLFLNGWAADASAFDGIREALPAESRAGRVFSWIEQLPDANGSSEFRRYLAGLKAPAILVAWSLGAVSAIRAAAELPGKVAGLVLLSGSPRLLCEPASGWPGVKPVMVKAMRLMLRAAPAKVLGEFLKAASAPMPLAEKKREPAPELLDIDALERGLEFLQAGDARECFRRIPASMPVSILHDRDDAVVPVAAAEALVRMRPSCRAVFTEGLGHLAPLRAPGKAAELIIGEQARLRIAASFGHAARTYDQCAAHQKIIAERLVREAPASDAIADLGCGTGLLAEMLERRFAPRALYAVDLSAEMLEACRERVPQACAIQAGAADVQLPERAGLIASACAFQWIADYAGLLRNVRANLRPGGTLAVAELLADNLPELREARAELGLADPAHPPYRTEAEIRAALGDAGFQIEKAFREPVTVWYPDAMAALKSFSGIGADLSAVYGTERLSPALMRRLLAIYERRSRTERGAPLTYSAFYYCAR